MTGSSAPSLMMHLNRIHGLTARDTEYLAQIKTDIAQAERLVEITI